MTLTEQEKKDINRRVIEILVVYRQFREVTCGRSAASITNTITYQCAQEIRRVVPWHELGNCIKFLFLKTQSKDHHLIKPLADAIRYGPFGFAVCEESGEVDCLTLTTWDEVEERIRYLTRGVFL